MKANELTQLSKLYSKTQELINNRSGDYCRIIMKYRTSSKDYYNFLGCDSWDISIDGESIGCNFQYTEGARGYYATYSGSISFPDIMFTLTDEEWTSYLLDLENKAIEENISYDQEIQRKKQQEEFDKQKRSAERELKEFQRLSAKFANAGESK